MRRARFSNGMCLAAALACACLAPPTRARAQSSPGSGDPASGAIHVYQRYLSSMRHMHCRFTPSCSQYAVEAIATYGLVEGSARAADRLMRCNTSADVHYARNSEGLLVDPVGQAPGAASAVRVPRWLLMPPEIAEPPVRAALAPTRRLRLEETVAFALELEARGDCERASTEYQRAGALADTADAYAWAYARIAHCYFGSGDWYFADRAYLTSAMLTSDSLRRAAVGFAGAASRFDAGAFAACARLLADSALAVSASADGPDVVPAGLSADVGARSAQAPGFRVAALTGLCAIAVGDWAAAGGNLRRSALEAPGGEARARVLRLADVAGSGPGLARRSPRLAGALSMVLPGAGQAYCGRVRDGVRHLLFNAALIYTVTSLARNAEVPGAVIVGAAALPFYMGNVIGAREAAVQFNQERRMQLLERAVEESSR